MKEYHRFLITDLLTQFSSGLIISSISWYAISIYRSNELVSNLTNTNLLSGLLVSLIIIPVIDKFNSKNIIQLSQLTKFILIVIATILFLRYNSQISLYILALSNGIGWNMYFPATKKLIQNLSTSDELTMNNAFAETTMQIGLFSSGLIAGILLKYFSLVYVLNIALILSFMAVIFSLSLKTNDGNYEVHNNTQHHYKLNYVYVFSVGILLYVPLIGANEINTILPGYVNNFIKGSSITYGSLDMMYGIGATLSGVLIALISKRIKNSLIIWIFFSIAILFSLLLYLKISIMLVYILLFIIGVVGPGIRILVNSFIMRTFPDYLLGKLMSTWNFINLIIQVIIIKCIGLLMDYQSANFGFIILSLTMSVGLIISFFTIHKRTNFND